MLKFVVRLFALAAASAAAPCVGASAASPPICPHIITWSTEIGAWCEGAPWAKVTWRHNIAPCKNRGAKVFYRPNDIPGGDDGFCYNGTAMAQEVLRALNDVPRDKWPDAIGYRNEFNTNDNPTPTEFIKYYDRLRAGGYTGWIVFGSYGVGWPQIADWGLPQVQAAVNKADAVETHEYFDLTVAYMNTWLAHRVNRGVATYPYLLGKPWFIGELGSDYLCREDPCCRGAWRSSNECGQKLSASEYINQLTIYRAGCLDQIVAAFVFQQGGYGWEDYDVIGTPVADWMRTTWVKPPATISGTVKNAAQQAIVGAVVSLSPGGQSATTNSSGQYAISCVTPGQYTIFAAKPGYANGSSVVTADWSQTITRDFTLNAAGGGTITGTVTASGGGALIGATVSTFPGGYSAITNTGGAFTIADVAPGLYTVKASMPGFSPVSAVGIAVSAGQTTSCAVVLTPGAPEVKNPAFDQGFFADPDNDHQTANGWRRFSQSGASKSGGFQNDLGHSPPWCQIIYEKSWKAGVYQQVQNCLPGRRYTFRCWVKSLTSSVYKWVGVDPTGGTDPASANVQWCLADATPNQWIQLAKQVTAQSDTITVFVKGLNSQNAVAYLHIDDASLSDDGGCESDPPINPTACTDLSGSVNGVWQSSISNPVFTWSGASDAGSGVRGYYVYFGPSPSGTSADFTKNAGYSPPTVSSPDTYYLRVRTQDNAGNLASWTTLYVFRYDNTGPSAVTVTDEGRYTSSDSRISASWTPANDPESGILRYEYAIGSTAGASDVAGWTDNGVGTSVTREGLSLSRGGRYYFTVRAVNGAGRTGPSSSSDGIWIAQVPNTIGEAKCYPDGTPILLSGVVTGVFADAVWVGDAARGAGMRVAEALPVSEGDTVSVAGILATQAGERLLTDAEAR